MKRNIKHEKILLTAEDSAKIAGGLLIPYYAARLAIRAYELGEKIINWLTTEH